MIAAPAVPTGVLLDYPLRLWDRQRQYTEELLREFTLLLLSAEATDADHHAPLQLVELATMFTSRFAPVLDEINAEREAAFARGLDRMDSHVPLVDGTPELLEQVSVVLAAADAYCGTRQMLVLPRPPELVVLSDWVRAELTRQYRGEDPTAWPGPFT